MIYKHIQGKEGTIQANNRSVLSGNGKFAINTHFMEQRLQNLS